ncbi:MAG: hypothetical protein ACK5D5_00260 [Bacteroidota bacterium]|jgi:hypothetical protein
MLKKILFVYLLLQSLTIFSQNSVSHDKTLDSVYTILKEKYAQQWKTTRFGYRIVMEKKDSVCIFLNNEISASAPAKIVRYPYQIFLDLRDNDFHFRDAIRKTINDSISGIIDSFRKLKFSKGKYLSNNETIELLESLLLKEPLRMRLFDVWITDNTAQDWVICETSELKHFPLALPTGLQIKILTVKEEIRKTLTESGL